MSELADFAVGSRVRRMRDPANGRCTLAVLTDAGWEEVQATAPGRVAEVRRLVFDP
ncbi:hypothetical protein [Streptomyces sp. NPDC001843]|uniref:hypothetical protein n=1 Tax=Streptomyces sp. NPDC001843 TaxID=3364617 RepID=UPI0036B4E14E